MCAISSKLRMMGVLISELNFVYVVTLLVICNTSETKFRLDRNNAIGYHAKHEIVAMRESMSGHMSLNTWPIMV